jgi:hypothetical protein
MFRRKSKVGLPVLTRKRRPELLLDRRGGQDWLLKEVNLTRNSQSYSMSDMLTRKPRPASDWGGPQLTNGIPPYHPHASAVLSLTDAHEL